MGTPIMTDINVEEAPEVNVKYASGSGGHASSGYESVLRDDSEFSSQSSSGGGSFPPPVAKEAACQTVPCEVGADPQNPRQPPQTSDALTTSFTDTVTVSATGDTMLASITSRSKLS